MTAGGSIVNVAGRNFASIVVFATFRKSSASASPFWTNWKIRDFCVPLSKLRSV